MNTKFKQQESDDNNNKIKKEMKELEREQNKGKWLDLKNTKNSFNRTCELHPFCNIQYEWSDESQKIKEVNCPLCEMIPNVILPDPVEDKQVTYNRITEENLDDWIAQSINRNIRSMLNPQRKYHIDKNLEKELKLRYKFKTKSFKLESLQQELYFPPTIKKKQENRLFSKSRKKDINEYLPQLRVDQQKLVPRCDSKGIPIRIREEKRLKEKLKETEKKVPPRRRGGVYLQNDYAYKRFALERQQQEQVNSKALKNQVESVKSQSQIYDTKNNIYSYNMENIFRKSIIEPVQSSIIQAELERMREISQNIVYSENQLVGKFAKLEEEYKNKINEKAQEANKSLMQINQGIEAYGGNIGNHGNNNMIVNIKGITEAQNKKQYFSNMHNTMREGNMKGISGSTLRKEQNNNNNNNNNINNIKEKVMLLLNNIQLSSEILDPELLLFEIHCQEMIIDKTENKPHAKWIQKAQEKIREKKYQLAIDCYKQSLMIYPESFIAVHNVASLLEKINLLNEAKKWFTLGLEFGQERIRVLFGLCIVCFKKSQFKESLNHVELIFGILKERKENIDPVYLYMRSLNYKKLGLIDNAKNDYRTIQPSTVPSNYNILANLMFSLVISKIRRLEIRFNCLTYMKFRQTMEYILQEPVKQIVEETKGTGVFQQKDFQAIAVRFSKLTFFKRFPISIIKKLLRHVKYYRIPKHSILSADDKETLIILSGNVILKNHEKNYLRPEYIGLFTEGDVIGAGELEDYLSRKPNLWYNTESDVEYLSMTQDDFASFWKAQFTLELDQKYVFLKNVKILQSLCQISLLKLCEFFEKKIFKRGTILFNDCSYRSKDKHIVSKGFGLGQKVIEQNAGIKYRKSNDLDFKLTKRGHSRLYELIAKHKRKINAMKFKNLRYPGLYILLKGVLEIEDDNGFRTTDFITRGDYFGENLIFEAEGFQRYGRIVVHSEEAELYFLGLKQIDKLILYEKNQMKISNEPRKDIETLEYIYRRFHEVQKVKIQSRQEIRKLKDS